jgi:hypothetical protein
VPAPSALHSSGPVQVRRVDDTYHRHCPVQKVGLGPRVQQLLLVHVVLNGPRDVFRQVFGEQLEPILWIRFGRNLRTKKILQIMFMLVCSYAFPWPHSAFKSKIIVLNNEINWCKLQMSGWDFVQTIWVWKVFGGNGDSRDGFLQERFLDLGFVRRVSSPVGIERSTRCPVELTRKPALVREIVAGFEVWQRLL